MEKKQRKPGSGIYERKSHLKGIYKIYGLMDPETKDIMYVGLTKQYICNRTQYHIYQSKTSKWQGAKEQWINSLLEKNMRPKAITLEILNTKNENEAKEKENEYINKYGILNKQTNTFEGTKPPKETKEDKKLIDEKIMSLKLSGLKPKDIAKELNLKYCRILTRLNKIGIGKKQKLIEKAKWIEKLREDYTDKEIRKMLKITEIQMNILDKKLEDSKWKGNL